MLATNGNSQYETGSSRGSYRDSRLQVQQRAARSTSVAGNSSSGVDRDRDSLRSADDGTETGGTVRSDPGGRGERTYNAGAVCIDEKVLKQISDNQTKFMQERITKVETNFGDLCDGFAKYARGLAKLRDRGDVIAKSLYIYGSQEALNPRTRDVIVSFSETIAGIQDYRETQIRRIEEKVVKPLSIYGTTCKQAKERLREACNARKRELDQKKELERSRDRNPWDRQRITKGQSDLQKANVNASKATDEVEQEMEAFEERKLQDIKQMAKDFLSVEMLFHVKALEMYSQCLQEMENLHEDEDLEYFRNSLRPLSSQSRINGQRAMQQQQQQPVGVNAGPSSRPTTAKLLSSAAATSTLTSTGASDWSTDSRPPRSATKMAAARSAQQASNANGNAKSPRNIKQEIRDEEEEEVDDDELDDVDDDDDDDEYDDDDDLDDDEDDVTDAQSAPGVAKAGQAASRPTPIRR